MTITVTTTDVADRWRPLTSAENTLAGVLLDDAQVIVEAAIPTLSTSVPDPVPNALVVRVLCSMVLRVLQNPEGLRQEAMGDYSYTRDQALSDGSLYLSAAEAALLTGALGTGTGTAFTIRPTYTAPTSALDGWA